MERGTTTLGLGVRGWLGAREWELRTSVHDTPSLAMTIAAINSLDAARGDAS
jgi:hypothetical protein